MHTTMFRPDRFASGLATARSDRRPWPFEEPRDARSAEASGRTPHQSAAYAQPDECSGRLIAISIFGATEQSFSVDLAMRQLMLPVVGAEFQIGDEQPIRCASRLGYRSRASAGKAIRMCRASTCWAGKGTLHQFASASPTSGRGTHFAVVDDMAFIHDVINRERAGSPGWGRERPAKSHGEDRRERSTSPCRMEGLIGSSTPPRDRGCRETGAGAARATER